MNIQLKRFTPEDWQTYKALRLESLLKEPDKFTGTYQDAAAIPDEEWIKRLKQPDFWAMWGMYDADVCIGLTGLVEFNEDPAGAYLIATYIRKEYRGKGLAEQYFQARIDHARQRGYKYLVVGHRANNLPSRRNIEKFGFQLTKTESKQWPDGSHDDILHYRLVL